LGTIDRHEDQRFAIETKMLWAHLQTSPGCCLSGFHLGRSLQLAGLGRPYSHNRHLGSAEDPQYLGASDGWSRKVLGRIYHPLYIREPKTLNLIPWLAEGEPVFDKDELSYTIRLRPAKWSDGSAFTSEDVAFTGNTINEFKVPRYSANWRFVKKTEVVDKHTVKFFLERSAAIFLGRTLIIPIVQKKGDP
jgi:peptide/nickel transport system substrate-binding protein